MATNNNNSTPSEVLPQGWESVYDPNSGRFYYAHRASGETRWDTPPMPLPPPPPPLPPPPIPPILQSNDGTNNTTTRTTTTGTYVDTQNTSMLGNNNSNGSSTLHPSAHNHSVTAAPADVAYSTSANVNNINNTNVSITQNNDARQKSAKEVSRLTEQRFQIGYSTNLIGEMQDEVSRFARDNFFTVRRVGKQTFVCTKADSWYEKAIISGTRELQTDRKRSTQASGCGWMLHTSLKGNKVTIDNMCSTHNHSCTASNLIVAVKKSGQSVATAIRSCTDIIAPIIMTRQPYALNLIRALIRKRLHPSIVLDAETVGSIIKGVEVQIGLGNYSPPPIIDKDVMHAFTSADIASTNADALLKDVLRNADPEKSWIVTELMKRLKDEDPYFDYRLHYDEHKQVDAVVWQTGPMRAALRLYGQTACFDTRNSDNMNTLRMRYLSFILQDANNQIAPASEAFVFEEEMELYLFVIKATYEMAPSVDPASLLIGSADYFLDPEQLKSVAPNVRLLVDEYHFLSAKNKTNILSKDFGPNTYSLIKGPFKKAFDAGTKDECFVSTCVL